MRLPIQKSLGILLASLLLCAPIVSVVADDAGVTKANKSEAKKSETKKADGKKAGDKTDSSKPAIVKLSGVFEGSTATELALETKQLKSLVIKKVAKHGSLVTKGTNVIWFKSDDVEEKLEDATRAFRLAELTMQEDEFNHRQFQATQQLDKAAANRAYKSARQAYDNFVQVDRDRQIASAKFSLKSSQASLRNVEEELKQLEQMYKEDELTEESEEIVLKRAKQSVESAMFRLEGTKVQTQRTLEQEVPLAEQERKDKLDRAELAHEKALRSLRIARQRADIEFDQKKQKFKEAKKDLEELRKERRQLVIQAPHDGVVYHGKLNRGKIGDKPSSLKADDSVNSQQAIATIVRTNRLQIRLDVPEKELRHFKVGQKATVIPTAFPAQKLRAKVKSISAFPFAGTKFDCVLSVDVPKQTKIIPGMSCEVELETAN